MAQKTKVYAKNIPELAEALGRSHPRLYRLEQAGRFHREAKGYDIEKIGEMLTTKPDISPEKMEAAKWDNEYKKWRALKGKLELAKAKGLLINRAEAVRAQVRKESEFVRAVQRLRFELPPKLHGLPYGEWPDIIDQAGTEVLATIGESAHHRNLDVSDDFIQEIVVNCRQELYT